MTRRRFVLPIGCVLALATALVFFQLAATLADRQTIDPARETGLVRAFYDAANDVLRTGDPTPLDAVLAAGLVDHGPLPGMQPNRTGLERGFIALHATFANLRLDVEDVMADGDRVTARLRAHGTPRPTFLGLPVPQTPRSWEQIDAFRSASGRLVEHWGSNNGGSLFQPLFTGPSVDVPDTATTVALARFTYAPGASLLGRVLPGPGLLVVQSGSIRVHGSSVVAAGRAAGGAAGSPATRGAEAEAGTVLRAGDAATLADGGASLLNVGPVPAVALGLAFIPARDSYAFNQQMLTRNGELTAAGKLAIAMAGSGRSNDPTRAPGGPSVRPLAESEASTPFGAVAIALGRVVLAPGAGLPPHRVAGAELLTVDAGALSLATDRGPVERIHANDVVERADPATETHIASGEAAFLRDGATVTATNAGTAPLVMLVLRVIPAGTRADSASTAAARAADRKSGPGQCDQRNGAVQIGNPSCPYLGNPR